MNSLQAEFDKYLDKLFIGTELIHGKNIGWKHKSALTNHVEYSVITDGHSSIRDMAESANESLRYIIKNK